MPLAILNPTADGTEGTWALQAGTAKWSSCVNPDDGDTSCISKVGLSGTSTQCFTMADLPAAAVTVTSISVRHRMRRATTVSPVSVCNGILKLGADILGPVIGGVYWNRRPETYYLDYFTPDIKKLDFTAWTVANVNAAEVGVRIASNNPPADAGELVYVTTVDGECVWNPAAAATSSQFAVFVGSFIGAVLGSALYREHMAGVARYFNQRARGGHFILRSELDMLLEHLRAPRRIYA